jgi:hypothetical protein
VLKIQYEGLFRMARDPNCSISDCRGEGVWTMEFKRALSVQEYEQWLKVFE